MRPTPTTIAAGLVITAIAALTVELVRRLAFAPPEASAEAVMESARNNSAVRTIVRSAVGPSSARDGEAERSATCARYCGDDLDFAAGVVRCPYGETDEH